MTKEVTLLFPTLNALLMFCVRLHVSNFEMNARECILTCECEECDIELAVIRYGARVVNTQGARVKQVS